MYDFTLNLIKEAGQLLEEKKHEKFSVSSKNDNPKDIVTSLDIELGEFITGRIREAYPAHGIHNEEATDLAGNEYMWTIDPIDGSAVFARGIPQYNISIGLLKDGVPLLGAVLDPVAKELFSFRQGEGAYLNGEKIQVSSQVELSKSFVLLAAGRKPEQFEWAGESLKKLLANASKVKNFGSSALWLCYIAAGRVEGVVAGTFSIMDVSAAAGILKEANGLIVDNEGKQVEVTSGAKKVYATNNVEIADQLRELLESD